jgi:DNA invertase Pin-like site-specific DNA recombinase
MRDYAASRCAILIPMPFDSPIAAVLAQRSTEDLEEMRERAQEVMDSAKGELRYIDDALGRKAKKPQRRVTKKGDTKKRVLDYIAGSAEPVGPAEVRDALNATGAKIGKSTIYNTFRRLVESKEIIRIDEGLYEIAARNGHRAEEIEEPTRLSSGAAPHEGQLLGSS